MSNFTIKAIEVLTDDSGFFTINPSNEAGYNILSTPFTPLSSSEPSFVRVSEASTTLQTVNPLFLSMQSAGMSMDEIHQSPDTRLNGFNQFKALDGDGNIVPTSRVSVLVVLWS